jgi:hypothetical protein
VIKKAEIDGIKWRTVKQLYANYLKGCQLDDGASAADVIAACLKERANEQTRFEVLGKTAEDYALFQDAVQGIDQRVETVRKSVLQIMLDDASTGKWLAIGRRGPDLAHQLIPARYWPFLTIDIENGFATGKDLEFRELRCAMTAGVPSAHPLLLTYKSANQLKLAEAVSGVGRNLPVAAN